MMNEKKVHFIGICGAGMSAVARLCLEQGASVTGSDEGAYPPVSTYLEALGLKMMVGHRAENIPLGVDIIVIGKHAKLTPDTNPEVASALNDHAEKVRSFPALLAELTENRERLVVAGSYGKSSVTGLIAWCLQQAGQDPGWFIGAVPKGFDHAGAMGGTGPFILEGDEYPSAHFDDRAKFLHYAPQSVLLTSATHDHVNIYPTLADYHAPFVSLLEGLEYRGGTLITCLDEPEAAKLFARYVGTKISYGCDPGRDVSATSIRLGDPTLGAPTRFTLSLGGEAFPDFETQLLGQHAAENIAGAVAYLHHCAGIPVDALREPVSTYQGVKRRLDRVAEDCALPVYEGFGSSYEKARAAITAIKAHFAGRQLVVLFEPHTFSWRNAARLSDYDTAFAGAQRVYLFPPPNHGGDTHDQLSFPQIVARTEAAIGQTIAVEHQSLSALTADLDPTRDVLLILSSGGFGGHLPSFLEELTRQFPTSGRQTAAS